MKLVLLIFTSLITFYTNAQDTTSARWIVEHKTEYKAGSSVMTNAFLRNLYIGGFINDDKIEKNAPERNSRNRAGASFSTSLSVQKKIDSLAGKQGFSFSVDIAHNQLISSVYAGDVYRLVFNGNRYFENETAILGNTHINYVSWYSLKAGLYKEGENKRYGVKAGIAAGNRNYTLNIDQANLYTGLSGSYLELDAVASEWQTDTNRQTLSHINGLGPSLAFVYSQTIPMEDKSNKLELAITDIGFIKWNDVIERRVDTSIMFSGFFIDEVLSLKDSVFVQKKDSLQNALLSSEKKDKVSMLPLSINLIYTHMISKKISLSGRINYMFTEGYETYAEITGRYNHKDKIAFEAGAGYGGFGRTQIKTGVLLTLPKFIAGITVLNLAGALGNMQGQAALITLKKSF